LNVVSTERGSIRKRYGSTQFLPELGTGFPSVSVLDSFVRANEKPLSNGGKWTVITGASTTGEVTENVWRPSSALPTEEAARWNVEVFAHPAVSVELDSIPRPERYVGLWACLAAAEKTGYLVRATGLAPEGSNLTTVTIERWTAGVKVVLATVTTELVAGDSLGVTVREGIVRAWRKDAGTWAILVAAADTTYTTGYVGMTAAGNLNHLSNFSAAATSESFLAGVEYTSLFECNIAGTSYLLASNGEKIWSITTAGVVTEIGSGFTAGSLWSFVQAPVSTGVASQGPVYMVNGVDKPQYWTGAEAKTKVKEWTGVESAPKLTDGVIAQNTSTLKSKTVAAVSSDVGLAVKFESTVKVELEGKEETITEAVIEAVIGSEELVLSLPGETGWKETASSIKFTIERNFYKEGKHVPNGQYMVFFGNRIWMTGITGDPSAVWFSELVSIGEGGAQADPSQWPATNVVRFDSADGYPITAIGSTGPYLCVFKEFATWVIHDLNTGANRRLSDTVGCIAQRSVVETNGGTFFLTANMGVYLTEGSRLHEMSYNIRPTILGINPAKRTLAAGAYYNNHYYLSFASGTSAVANRTVDYDVQLKSWWLHDLTSNQWVTWEPANGKVGLYAIPPAVRAGVVQAFVPGVYTDRESVYTGTGVLAAYWLSPWEPFAYYIFRHRIKAPFLKKRIRQIFFNGEGQIIPLVYKNFLEGGRQEPATIGNQSQAEPEVPTNFDANEEEWGEGSGEWGVEGPGESLWGGEQTVGSARIYSPGVGNVWSVGWGNNSDEPFIVDAFVYMVQFRKS